jgi:NAD(P)H-dependent flavin oxidoreductase YrpB (nitropropane dioxygenase family)
VRHARREFPILAFSHCRDVIAAVSNAGGFGVLGAVAHTPEQLEIDLAWIEAETNGKPYGVDLLLPQKYAGADEGGLDRDALRALLPAEQQQFIDAILRRYEVPPLPDDARRELGRRGGMSVSPRGYEPLLDVAFAHRMRLIASALGPPPPELIERAHANDVVVAALAGRASHAARHHAAGVDLIVAQGHRGGRPHGRGRHHGADPRGRRRRHANPGHRGGRDRQWSPDRRGHGTRRRGGLVRVGVARYRGG